MKTLRRFVAAIDADDVLYFGGLALVSLGAYQAYGPAGPVVAGVGLLYLAKRGN